MSGLIWTPEALEDVQRLYRWLQPKNVDAAKRAAGAIRSGVAILGKQPMIGRPVDGMDPDYRERLIDFGDSGYVVLYRVESDMAVILAVRHQKEAGYY